MKAVILSKELVGAIQQYLITRPYQEVITLIKGFESPHHLLKEIENYKAEEKTEATEEVAND